MTTRAIDHQFTGPITHPVNPASWTVVFVPDSRSILGTGTTVKVKGKIDGHTFTGTLMPDGNGGHFLSLNSALRKTVGKQVGENVDVHLTEQY